MTRYDMMWHEVPRNDKTHSGMPHMYVLLHETRLYDALRCDMMQRRIVGQLSRSASKHPNATCCFANQRPTTQPQAELRDQVERDALLQERRHVHRPLRGPQAARLRHPAASRRQLLHRAVGRRSRSGHGRSKGFLSRGTSHATHSRERNMSTRANKTFQQRLEPKGDQGYQDGAGED